MITAQFKPGDRVLLCRGKKKVPRVIGDGSIKDGKILTLGGRSGKEEYWELATLLEKRQIPITEFELLEALDDECWTSIVTLTVHFYQRCEESEILELLTQLEDQNRVFKALCPDGKTYSWRRLFSVDSDLKCAVFNCLSNEPKSEWQVVKNLEYQYSLQQVQRAFRALVADSLVIQSSCDETILWQRNLESSISALALGLDIPSRASHSALGLNSSDFVKSTTTASVSLDSDTLALNSLQTSETPRVLPELEPISSQLASLASLSALPENGTGQSTSATSFQPSLESLTSIDPSVSPLKMSPASSPVPTSPENPPEDFLGGCFGSFTAGGTMLSGKLSEAVTLALPSLEKDLFWLPSPQALSTLTGRPAGQSKLEVQLKELKLLGGKQVLNPEFLSKALCKLPWNWANLLELRAAVQMHVDSAKLTEIPSTPESLLLSLAESHQLSVQVAQPETFIQNDPSSFIWQGAGLYWIYPESVPLNLGTQSRVETDAATVGFYSAQMRDNLWEWEASIVGLVWDGDQLLVYDGHHRLKAAAVAEKMVLARIAEGNLEQARALSCGSNKKPSLRRTREDNQKTIQMLEDLRSSRGDAWLLEIINASLPGDKQFAEVSLRAIEAYTGIPFRTISNIRQRVKSTQPASTRISFLPSEDEMGFIESIMAAEDFERPSEVLSWLIKFYKTQNLTGGGLDAIDSELP